jgi:hypothetical protein
MALRDGLSIGWAFGLGSLEELARSAVQLERGIYREGSLVRTPSGVDVVLWNPPLRIGAFREVRVYWDTVQVDPARGRVATERRPAPRPLSSVTASDPLELAVGEGSRYELDLEPRPGPGTHRVRIEWSSVAIPPLVWLDVRDELAASEGNT